MNKVTINGKTYSSIHSISVSNNTVTIDGNKIEHGETENGILGIKIEGIVENIECDGSVTCDDVHGTVQAGGSVSCDNVDGTVQAGGSVTCDNISGNVMAGGSVLHG